MSDCMAYTEAKQLVIPFNKKGDQEMLLRALMHVDIWGKYKIASINGNYYYLLLVDDALCNTPSWVLVGQYGCCIVLKQQLQGSTRMDRYRAQRATTQQGVTLGLAHTRA